MEGKEWNIYYIVKELGFFGVPATLAEIAEESGLARDEVEAIAQRLIEQQEIKKSGDGYILADESDERPT
jgi:DNA-binding IclR family transcriptional regulator